MFRGQITRGLWRLYTQRLTPAGRWMLLVSAILIGYGGSSLQIQAYVLASYLIFVWIVALAAAALLRPKVTLDVNLPYRVAAGDVLIAKLKLRQRRWVHGGDVSVAPFNLPLSIDALPPDGVIVPDLRRSAEEETSLSLRFQQRGLQQLKGFRITSSFPFGLIRSRRTIRLTKSVLVYPAFIPLESFELPPAGGREAAADLIASRLGDSFEFLGNREYREGDSPRDINWRATARMPQPIVREWIEERQVRVSLFLDDCFDRAQMRQHSDSFEASISMTAAIAEILLRKGVMIRRVVIGQSVDLEGLPHRPPDLQSILDALATVKATNEKSVQLSSIQHAAEQGDAVVMVLQALDQARRDWIESVKSISPATKVIVIEPDSSAMVASSQSGVVHLSVSQVRAGVGSV